MPCPPLSPITYSLLQPNPYINPPIVIHIAWSQTLV